MKKYETSLRKVFDPLYTQHRYPRANFHFFNFYQATEVYLESQELIEISVYLRTSSDLDYFFHPLLW